MARCLILLVRGHQKSPLPLKVRTHCIYIPICSQYVTEVLKKYGALKGTWLACKRILRCHPFAESGYDPAPQIEGGSVLNSIAGTVLLTKTGGIPGPIADILGWIMDLLFRFTSTFEILNTGLYIILFTLVTKMLMIPLTIKQQKSSELMAVMQPEITAIQRKYKDEESDQKYAMMTQTEIRVVYEKYGVSMIGGCLPFLIRMPIIFALYRVIYNVPAYVQSVRVHHEAVVSELSSGYEASQASTGPVQVHKMVGGRLDYTNVNTVIDSLYKLTGQQWDLLVNAFSSVGQAATEAGVRMVDVIENMQSFFGLNIAYTPPQVIMNYFNKIDNTTLMTVFAALCTPLLAGLSQWYSTKPMAVNQSQQSEDAPGANMMKSMNMTMPLMSIFFCFSFASGIGFYWATQSVSIIIQQVGINSYLNKVDIDDLVQKNIEKANKKRTKKGLLPTKVGNVDEMLKKIEAEEEEAEQAQMAKIVKTRSIVEEPIKYYNDNAKSGSLTVKANIVSKYNEKHEKGKK